MSDNGISCWQKDKEKSLTLERCKPDREGRPQNGCTLHYIFDKGLFVLKNGTNGTVTTDIQDRSALTTVVARCINLDYYPECTVYTNQCEHYWTTHTQGDKYDLHCCCTTSGCNHKSNTMLNNCLNDDCTTRSGKRKSCFCPPDEYKLPEVTNIAESKDAWIVKTMSVGIALVGFAIAFFIYTTIKKSRSRDEGLSQTRQYPLSYSNEQLRLDPDNEREDEDEDGLKPLIKMPDTVEEQMDEKFKDFRYCFDGPNELSLLGEGRYGAVHRVENRKNGEVYAMKIFRHKGQRSEATSPTGQLMWRKEFEHLNLCADENIVKREGAGKFKFHGTWSYAILLEYCPMGSLSTYLDKVQNEKFELPLLHALKIAQDIASGMEFLHDYTSDPLRAPVAHRDIKSSNILLKAPNHAVISDFGLAIALRTASSQPDSRGSLDIDVNRIKQCGTPRYLSPELLEGQMDVNNFADAFRQADVYSMSIVHWELFRMANILNPNFDGLHELPFAKELNGRKANIDSLQSIVTKGVRPIIPEAFQHDKIFGDIIKKILTQSWDGDPCARINAATVSERLQNLIEKQNKLSATVSERLQNLIEPLSC